MATTMNPSSTGTFPGARPGTVAGVTYAAAWAIGLAAFEPGPAAGASRADVAQFFADRPVSTTVQSVLVHGIAAAALLVVVGLLIQSAGSSRLLRGATAAAVCLSFLQLGLGVGRSLLASGDTIAALSNAIGRVDGLKMLMLALLIAESTRLLRTAALIDARAAVLGIAATAALAVSGVAYLAGLQAIYGSAVVSLLLLVVWVVQTGVVADRAHR